MTDSSVARLVVLLLRHPSRSSDSDFCKRPRPGGRFVAKAGGAGHDLVGINGGILSRRPLSLAWASRVTSSCRACHRRSARSSAALLRSKRRQLPQDEQQSSRGSHAPETAPMWWQVGQAIGISMRQIITHGTRRRDTAQPHHSAGHPYTTRSGARRLAIPRR